MSKEAYIGVDGASRKISRMYVGVEGLSRRIKKAYVGVGGVAKLFFSLDPIEHIGTVTPLSQGKEAPSGASNAQYAIFAGGLQGYYDSPTDYYDSADAYNSALTRTSAPSLSVGAYYLASGSAGDYAIFAGGANGGTNVDAYDLSLSRISPSVQLITNYMRQGVSLSDCFLVVGGNTRVVQKYDDSLTTNYAANTTSQSSYMGVARAGGYALLLPRGGANSEAYDSSLTKISVSISDSRNDCASASVGEGTYALFAGGRDWVGDDDDTVHAVDASLTATYITPLQWARHWAEGATTKSFAMFAGGYLNSRFWNSVDAYDPSLTRTNPPGLKKDRALMATATVGHYVLFAGGADSVYDYGISLDIVEAYSIN